MRKWLAVVIVGLALVVVVALLADSAARYNAEREQTVQNIQQWAQATLTAEAK